IEVGLAQKLKPIVCVGESLAQREAGQTEAVLAEQLQSCRQILAKNRPDEFIIAYEPIWAIGTGHSAAREQVQQTHSFIRTHVAKNDATIARSLRLLYGGSVKPTNAAQLLCCPDVDGALVGGASLKADSFLAIAQAAAQTAR